VSGDLVEVTGRSGRLSVVVAGRGPPVLLLHSINAAASAAEIAPVHDHLSARHRVYSPDLPGFGLSERSDRDYCIRLYVDAVHDVLDLIEREQPGEAVRALSLSLSGEFLARAALEAPARFAALVLVTPTAFNRRADRYRGPAESSRQVDWLYRFLKRPRVGAFLYRQLTRPGTIRYFLRRTFGRRDVDETLWRYCCASVRVPGARHAPIAFLSARLFSGDIRTVYEGLARHERLPVWLPHATRGDFKDFSGADWVRALPHWRVEPMPSGALPWFECPEHFHAGLDDFLDGAHEAG
jgi:pimeloyl-ACP methyl ester carboxylesterase